MAPVGCAVESLFPDVQWTTDDIFSRVHSPDWLFTHIRVTKLPPLLAEECPLVFATPDSLGFAVAMALQRCAEPRRVLHYTGHGEDLTPNFYDRPDRHQEDFALFAEYVPVGPLAGAPETIN
jgi:hypothetical protein